MFTPVVIRSVSLTVGAAVVLAGFGLVLLLRARRKGDRATGPAVLVGFPGLFLSLLASIDGPRWLYIGHGSTPGAPSRLMARTVAAPPASS